MSAEARDYEPESLHADEHDDELSRSGERPVFDEDDGASTNGSGDLLSRALEVKALQRHHLQLAGYDVDSIDPEDWEQVLRSGTIPARFSSGVIDSKARPKPAPRLFTPSGEVPDLEVISPQGPEAQAPVAGHFADRVTGRRVDLVQRIQDGVPQADYLPASDGMLRRGKRHQWVAPKKVGKSIGALAHGVDIVLAGARVVIFDRENGGDLYAARLEGIIDARKLDDEQRTAIAAGLNYYEFPRFRAGDEAELVALCTGADLVVFDSQRMYLSDLGLDENDSDDYADFMAALIDPLFRASIATLILDNSGHVEAKRGRGTSSKGDLNEILFALEGVEKFDLETAGRLRLEITDSRFGNTGRWEMEIGGGVFGSWQRIGHAETDTTSGGFRPTGLMERASCFLEMCHEPPSRTTITDAIGGKAKYARLAVDVLVREGYARTVKTSGTAHPVESVKPYREADDPLKTPADEPDRVPTASQSTDADRVPTASPQEPLNQAVFETASHRVPTASPTASPDRVPIVVPPTGNTQARPAQSEPTATPDDDLPF